MKLGLKIPATVWKTILQGTKNIKWPK